jgi:hypothetical protein
MGYYAASKKTHGYGKEPRILSSEKPGWRANA